MSYSIWIRGGTVKRQRGEVTDITPNLASNAAKVLWGKWGDSPIELSRQEDLEQIASLASGASAHVLDGDNFWWKIAVVLQEFDTAVVGIEP